ncbi:MAG: hypothetical protein GWP44_13595, partial [Proteobacteria bacterium]|nr:hypothetical protein [Pseudomonadota bacterium]
MTSIRIDFGNLMSPQTEGGVSPDLLRGDMAERFTAAMVDVAAQREAGVLGFLDLPYAADHVAQVKELADGFGQWFEDVVVLGIGGSGLGATSLRDALLGPFWNSRSDEARDHYPRLHV